MDNTENNEHGILGDLYPVQDMSITGDSVFLLKSPEDIELHGVTVFAVFSPEAEPDSETVELLARARTEAEQKEGSKVSLVLVGSDITTHPGNLQAYGADRIFIYDDPQLRAPEIEGYISVFRHFLKNYKPEAIMGTTNRIGKVLLSFLIRANLKYEGESIRTRARIRPEIKHCGELIFCEIPETIRG